MALKKQGKGPEVEAYRYRIDGSAGAFLESGIQRSELWIGLAGGFVGAQIRRQHR